MAMSERIHVLLLLAPLIFVCHVVEELPGFVEWFNSHVARGITQELFLTVNTGGLIIILIIVVNEWFSRSRISLAIAVAWLSFMMLANGIFHIAATILDRQYVPGVITSVVLYLPYTALFFSLVIRSRRISLAVMAICVLVGSIPMLLHGYLILFRGSRLV